MFSACVFQSDVKLIKAGDKVGASEATLLNMLKISPFTYGLEIEQGMYVAALKRVNKLLYVFCKDCSLMLQMPMMLN